ncbi:MAG: SDR family oxidoreductase [Lewinella sp.]|nr:SDR family oxidoreductase [Lewinella sp.]
MQAKTILITGANDGIGLATAERLAHHDVQLILACRDEKKGLAAAQRIGKITGNTRSLVIALDLASFASVAAAAEFILTEHPKIDVLINNAGLYTQQLLFTKEGYELQFGVNHLGHFLLTLLLIPAFQCLNEGLGRVINVSSAAHLRGKLDFNRLRGEEGPRRYLGMAAYGQSKLANILFTKELARRYPNDFTANCLHPGLVSTRFGNKAAGPLVSCIWNLYKPLARKPSRGADTSVYLALSPEVNNVSGRYFDQRQCIRKPAPLACDAQLAAQLWDYSQAAVADYLPKP